MDLLNNMGDWLKVSYLIFAFCSALFLGALKGSHNFYSFFSDLNFLFWSSGYLFLQILGVGFSTFDVFVKFP